MRPKTAAIVVLLSISLAQSEEDPILKQKFEEHGLVPDVIGKAPGRLVKVYYGENGTLQPGEVLPQDQIQGEPEKVSWEADPDELYTLIMTDIDAPSKENRSDGDEKRWLVVNIPGYGLAEGEVRSPYEPPQPAAGTGLHRFIFLVYKQSQTLNSTDEDPEPETTTGESETSTPWTINDFARVNELGDPIAGNFFRVEGMATEE
ncbi:protein D2 [Galendromus occidentalis]|uniref:Protein D2 n=1 Tax=Galendromus occidentalis TaxID=34638 RepID=A0AAJ6QTY2_9ACAR|nr:protein D2 [Galendromus occidentalis]